MLVFLLHDILYEHHNRSAMKLTPTTTAARRQGAVRKLIIIRSCCPLLPCVVVDDDDDFLFGRFSVQSDAHDEEDQHHDEFHNHIHDEQDSVIGSDVGEVMDVAEGREERPHEAHEEERQSEGYGEDDSLLAWGGRVGTLGDEDGENDDSDVDGGEDDDAGFGEGVDLEAAGADFMGVGAPHAADDTEDEGDGDWDLKQA
jgi:hypothetical protein